MNSIRRQLTLWTAAAVVVLYGLASTFCFVRTKQVLWQQFDADLVDRARVLSTLVVRDPDGRLEVMPADASMPEFGAGRRPHYRHRQFLQVWDADGKTVQRSPSLRGADISPPPPDGP